LEKEQAQQLPALHRRSDSPITLGKNKNKRISLTAFFFFFGHRRPNTGRIKKRTILSISLLLWKKRKDRKKKKQMGTI